jgi:hypothetical protein
MCEDAFDPRGNCMSVNQNMQGFVVYGREIHPERKEIHHPILDLSTIDKPSSILGTAIHSDSHATATAGIKCETPRSVNLQ